MLSTVLTGDGVSSFRPITNHTFNELGDHVGVRQLQYFLGRSSQNSDDQLHLVDEIPT